MVKGVKCKRTSARKGIVCLILMIAVTLILASCAGQSGEGDSSAGAGGSGDAPAQNGGKNGADPPESVIVEGEDLVIPVADITEKASFYPVQVDGTQMEIIAVKAPDGTLRTAFNTCQICFDSGRGYYVQTGDVLVCQNCGNQVTMNSVEVDNSQ